VSADDATAARSTGGPPTTRKARAGQTRRRLVAAAVEHFSERHYDEVSVSDIAETAGVAHGLLFHYFQSKRGLYLEAMHEAASELDWVDKVVDDLPLGVQLQSLLQGHLEYLAEHRGLALRLVLGGRGTDPEAWDVFEAGRWRVIDWVCSRLGLDPRSDALRIMLRAAIGAVDEATVHWLTHGKPYEAAELSGALLEMATNCLHAAALLDPSIDVEAALQRAAAPPERSPEAARTSVG
jgi:AcrR family transcriptional regulator